MSFARCLVVVPLVCAVLPAQATTIAVISSTPIAALTDASGPQTLAGIASGVPITSTDRVFATTSQSPTGKYLSATTICYPTQPYQDGIGVNFFERAYARGTASDVAGTSAATTAGSASFAPHAIVCTFRAPAGTVGNVRLSFRASFPAQAHGGVVLDLGNDGNVDFTATRSVTTSFPVTISASGSYALRISNECVATGDGSANTVYAWTEISVGFWPDLTARCTYTAYGQSCGPQAAGGELIVGSSRIITLAVTGAFASMPVLALTGTRPLDVPLPGNCRLLCNADDVAVLTADALGNATHTFSVPVTLTGTGFHQFAPLTVVNNALVLTTSNGVRTDCVH